MLSRTADHLFWMARYMERAENTARMLDINSKACCCRRRPSRKRARNVRCCASPNWKRVRGTPSRLDPRHMLDFMVADPGNPSSINACLHATRENARAVRGTLTTEGWETINYTWLEFGERLASGELGAAPTRCSNG